MRHPTKIVSLSCNIACLIISALLARAQTLPTIPVQTQLQPKLAAPVEPISAIVQAFQSHAVVALGNVEFRGNEQAHAFQVVLIRDPRFAAVANDILVEFGNSRYQDFVDRFIRGEDVSHDSLRRVWQNTTQVEYEWDLPIYGDFFRAVRAVNASLPRTRQLRVLLGDPPIDWEQVHSLRDLQQAMGDRDDYALNVLRREVLAKNRRALVIYGSQHLIRRNTVPDAANQWARGIVARMEKDQLASAFTILPETRRDLRVLQANVASWPIPSLAVLRDTVLGSVIWDPGPNRRSVLMENQFDAILYLGPPSSMRASKLAPELCSDPAYMEMRLSRLALIPPPPGATFTLVDQLKDYCTHPGVYTEIPDPEPAITELIRKTLRDAAHGKVDPENIARESRNRLIAFLERDGPRYLAPAGNLESLVLLEDRQSGEKRVRRYRSVFASGLTIIWTVELSSADSIVSLNPRPE
jgi:hypothetical protein